MEKMRPVREIIRELENRVTHLLGNFNELNKRLDDLLATDFNIELESDPRSQQLLDQMIALFLELKPVERIVRYKQPELTPIFEQLGKIEFERTHGKFFSFLAVMPGQEKKRGPKPKQIKLVSTIDEAPRWNHNPNQTIIE